MELLLQIFSYKLDHLISAIFAVGVLDRKGLFFYRGIDISGIFITNI